MNRSVLFFTCFLVLIFSIGSFHQVTKAQVNEGHLEQYLSTLNWTQGELEEYLATLDSSIDAFQSLEELKAFVGPSITNNNLNDLLGKYNMTHNDLETLLAEYGETLDDYKFIDDLEIDVQFFLRYQEEFSIVSDFLSLFGLTEDEMENVFEHVRSLNEEVSNQKLANLFESLEALSYLQGVDELSREEQEQIFSLWDEMFSALNIDARFYLVKDDSMTPTELQSLLTRDTLDESSLYMALHNLDGDVLATFIFSEDMVDSHLMYESLEQFGEIIKLAQQYQELLVKAKLPITAGHFVTNMLVSIFFIVAGFVVLVVRRRVIV
jgi:processed acidic surface protein